ncbi:energy-coupling factor transport system permease protein [Saccharothrix tamanrassetensis]|uniref:Energy-coupling factor transport system permease protein n=1 Tax=Saccharothrix tamanrassetensis TaxID=1051531 RepID=A0A841CBM2_9PSEU|nr:energy-coupling factor transporter transmembrane protein EcfT [Saccharothrix tamanrassetensis]MBB5953568.1 energy-coupling factor transport system permease protein [Saccharothrix tamanrassetensis]
MNRALHPGAWWLWALGLAAVGSRTTNPLMLGLVIAIAGFVAVTCRQDTPWASSYGVFLKFGLVVIGIRVAFHVLLGGIGGPTVLFALPEVPLPDWARGIRLGGPVTAEGLVFALYQGLQLATLLCCVGAANALANAKRLLRSLPAALYEVSVAVVVAMTVAPQLVAGARSVRRARALRGEAVRGIRAVKVLMVPVLEDAFERSLVLAAAMDSRGYGRNAGLPTSTRLLTGALVLGGLIGLCVGAYGLLDGSAPTVAGVPMLALGTVLAVAGLRTGSRRVRRSRYRPDTWGAREALVVGSALVAALATVFSPAGLGGSALSPATVPLEPPQLPLLPALGLLCALAPVLTPERKTP